MTSSRTLCRSMLLLLLVAWSVRVFAQADPPSRVGSLSAIEGSVAVAPAGETEWVDAPLNRPVTPGDRVWTDTGGRADVNLGSAVLHMDGETFLEMRALDDNVLQSMLREGVMQARLRVLRPGELFQIDTPQLAFRAIEGGTYRIDADPARGTTRIAVRAGTASIAGASGRTLTLSTGQQVEVAGTDLEQVVSIAAGEDDFDRWAMERDAREDQSVAARYVPLDVVGASQLDPYGSWMQDPGYGMVWYPRAVAVDWAPYRYGRWQWIKPWGWTWIDNAPWGFAPFHYGRWALIGSRWAWVPGRLRPRPVYAPALVAFVGGGASGPLPLGSGQGIAWYPLAPGEVWRPFFAATPAYVRRVNQSLAGAPVREDGHSHRTRLNAITALRVEDFRSGQPVQRRWERPNPVDLARAQPLLPPPALPARAANAAPRVMPAPLAAAPPNAVPVPHQPNVAPPPPVPRPRVFDAPPGRYPVPVSPEQARMRAQQEQPWPHQTLPPRASSAQPAVVPPPLAPTTNAPATRRDDGERRPQQEGPRHEQRPSGEQQDDGARRRQGGRVN